MPKESLRVVYWNNIPSPYMVERFNALARRGNLNFQAWFNTRLEAGRSWDVDESQWTFPFRYVPSIQIAGRTASIPIPLLSAPVPDVLVSLYAEPSFLAGWWLARRRRIRTAIWVEVTFDRWFPRRPWKEALKRWLFGRVDGVLTVGQQGRAFARHYGAPDGRIFYASHVIDVEHFANGRDEALASRSQLRSELGLRGVTFINVGRLWWGKGLDTLLDAYAEMERRAEGEVSLLLVGDGPEEAHLRRRCAEEGLQHVVFAGFQQKAKLPRYYAASDVFVFPTLGDPYGLVVDEAMACSLPVISTSAAGEIGDRVVDGENGFIVPPENSAALLVRMEELAADEALRERMGQASRERIEGHTPERWAQEFELAVSKLVAA